MTKNIPQFFINAFYESKFKDNFFVIKAGGKIIEDDKALDSLLANIRDLTHHGIKILLVYGGGQAMDNEAKARGIEIKKHEGRRITDEATLNIMKDVIAGRLSLKVQESMARCSLNGLSFNAVPEEWMHVDIRPKTSVDFGFVGDIHGVETRPINRLFKVTNFIACACLATTSGGQIVNINADTIATEIAIATAADKLILLSDVDGVDVDGKTAFIITSAEIPGLIEKGTVSGGMKVKMENCLRALNAGVRRIHLISGLRENALKKEIYESVGPGTMLISEHERESYLNEIEAHKVIEGRK